jgi:hypothetical protein
MIMPIDEYWINQPWLFGVDYHGAVTAEEIETVMAKCLATVTKQPTYFLVDTTDIISVPSNLLKLGSLVKFINHPNTQWLVFVGVQNSFIRFAMQVLVRKKVKVIADRGEALDFLQARIREEQDTPP